MTEYLTDADRERYGVPAYEADGNGTVFTEEAVDQIAARVAAETLRDAAMSIEFLPEVTGVTVEQHDEYVRQLLRRVDRIEQGADQ